MSTTNTHAERIAAELNLRPAQVRAALELFAAGNTIPFVARYRKEATGELDEVQLRDLRDRNEYLVELDARRATILASIEEQGKLDDALRARERQRLGVGIGNHEIDPIEAGRDHVVDGIAAGPADAEDGDAGFEFLDVRDREVDGHGWPHSGVLQPVLVTNSLTRS